MSMLNKEKCHQSDLIDAIYERTGYDKNVIKDVILTFVDEMPHLLAVHGYVNIKNFGTFRLIERKKSINPKTQQPLEKNSIHPTFKQSKNFKSSIRTELDLLKK